MISYRSRDKNRASEVMMTTTAPQQPLMEKNRKLFSAVMAVLLAAACAASAQARSLIESVQLVSPDEVFVKVQTPVEYKASAPKRSAKLIVDFINTNYPLGSKTLGGQGGQFIKQLRLSQFEQKTRYTARLAIDLAKPAAKDSYAVIEKPDGLRIVFGKKEVLAAQAAAAAPAAQTAETAQETPAQPPSDKPAQPAHETAAAPVQPPQAQPAADAAPAIPLLTGDARLSSKRVTLNLRGMPLTVILEAISKQTGASFIIAKELQTRQYTALMEDVTLRDALRGLLEIHGLAYEQVGNSSTFVIKELGRTKMRLTTRIFRLKYTQLVNVQAKSITDKFQTGGEKTAASAKVDATSNNFLAVVQGMISEYGSMRVYPETNSIIISDVPESFPAIEELIENLDTPVPQIMIETYFVETNANNLKNLGISYGSSDGTLGAFQGNSALVSFPFTQSGNVFALPKYDFTANPPGAGFSPASNAFYGNYSFGLLSFSQLTAVLKAIETSGDSQFLSKPKVLTLNNKPAEIAITADTVVQFETKLFTGSGYLGEQATNPIRQTTGITLWVTPQVNDGGMITLIVTPEISRPAVSTFFPNNNVVDTQREAITTSVRVKDGSTVLIGGLISNEDTKTVRRVPLLGHLPIIGMLFTSTSKTKTERELLIFITPKVVKDQ